MMMERVNNVNAVNFGYLLLDYYKELKINEAELAVLLMIDHLNSQDNAFVTSDELVLKMSMSKEDIDKIMAGLYAKNYIEFSTEGDKPSISIRPLKKLIYRMFRRSIFTEEELSHDEELENKREKVFDMLERFLDRELSPIEINQVDTRVRGDVSVEVIDNVLKDAKNKNITSMIVLDRMIIKRVAEEDKDGNARKK
jgi:DNA replication protein